MKIEKILHPTDFSENANNALEYALMLAEKFSAKIYVLHVVYEPAEYTGFYVPHISFDKIRTEIEAGAKKMMDDLSDKYLNGKKNVEKIISIGNPPEEIIKFSQDKEIDTIVIGTLGKKGIERLVFGSTAEKVIKNAYCNVVCVKPKME